METSRPAAEDQVSDGLTINSVRVTSPPAPKPPPTRTAGKKRSGLSTEAIVDAAIQVMDESGMERLSMRQVAQRLGTGAASLYGYVSGKEELLELVFDQLVGQVHLAEPDPARWREQVVSMLQGLRHELAAHRDVAVAGLGRVPTSAKTLRAAEVLVATLRAGGINDRAAALGFDQLVLYVCAFAYEESLYGHSDMDAEAIVEYFNQVHAFFRSLPAARFPVLSSLSDAMTGHDRDERFEFGIDVFLSGLVALSERESHRDG
jgi:AcrR family transcriptional regulator